MNSVMNKLVIGVDIGGANLKYASACGMASSRAFAMWREPENLATALAEDLQSNFFNQQHAIETLAVTMTGELADCFIDREVGVQYIVEQTCHAAAQLGLDHVQFYGVDGLFHNARAAGEKPDLIAAANWHALANFIGREVAADALLIDIGSTTTDIIPITQQQVATTALTDHDRLCEHSLVYVGCKRTPVCSLVDTLEYRGVVTPVMNEQFATIDDALLLLGLTTPDPHDSDSADGNPRTQPFAANRLARMIGLDRRVVTDVEAQGLAQQVATAATQRIVTAINDINHHAPWVLSGHGLPLVPLTAGHPTLRLADQLGHEIARCAPAYAVSRLIKLELQ